VWKAIRDKKKKESKFGWSDTYHYNKKVMNQTTPHVLPEGSMDNQHDAACN